MNAWPLSYAWPRNSNPLGAWLLALLMRSTPIQYIGDSVAFLQSAQANLELLLSGYSAVFQDVSDCDLPASVSHRVKAIEQSVDLTFLRTEIPKAFERTQQVIQRVAAIVRAMKEFAHPGSNEQSPADSNHALETTLIIAHNEYKYCARVETTFAELPPLMCNVGGLNQVFLNLIVNAAHAISETDKDATEGTISISTALSGEHAVICIADNGCGIPADNLEKVFDPFFTTKPVGRGIGQGLAIARSIVVEKHGGHIDVESVVGSGTRFVLRLPMAGRSAADGPL